VTKAEGYPGSVVEADGHDVYFHCEGEGSPTVVFLSGLGTGASTWSSVFDDSARLTRSCQYDRYGLGVTGFYGVLPQRARNADDQVRELEQLLEHGKIEAPYVFVGHSWGGALARLYAGRHDDVEGVVFVDSSTPGQDTALIGVLPPERPDDPELFTELRRAVRDTPLESPEYLDWSKSLEEVGQVTSLGDRPEIVISAGSTFGGDEKILRPVWRGLQTELAGLSSNSVHALAPASAHFVQSEAPAVVRAAVRAAVNAVRNHGKLAPCATIFDDLGHEVECLH
jgi:pimeloyl-ACP methyl ester carboxylesterase